MPGFVVRRTLHATTSNLTPSCALLIKSQMLTIAPPLLAQAASGVLNSDGSRPKVAFGPPSGCPARSLRRLAERLKQSEKHRGVDDLVKLTIGRLEGQRALHRVAGEHHVARGR